MSKDLLVWREHKWKCKRSCQRQVLGETVWISRSSQARGVFLDVSATSGMLLTACSWLGQQQSIGYWDSGLMDKRLKVTICTRCVYITSLLPIWIKLFSTIGAHLNTTHSSVQLSLWFPHRGGERVLNMLTARCFLVCNMVTAGSLLLAGYFYQEKLLEAPSPRPHRTL